MAQLNQVLKSPLHFTSESHPSPPRNHTALPDTPRCSVERGEAEQMGYTPLGKVRERIEFITSAEAL